MQVESGLVLIGREQVNASWVRYCGSRSDAIHFQLNHMKMTLTSRSASRSSPGAVSLLRSAQSGETSLQRVKLGRLAFRPVEVQIKSFSTRESCRRVRDYLQLIKVGFGEQLV